MPRSLVGTFPRPPPGRPFCLSSEGADRESSSYSIAESACSRRNAGPLARGPWRSWTRTTAWPRGGKKQHLEVARLQIYTVVPSSFERIRCEGRRPMASVSDACVTSLTPGIRYAAPCLTSNLDGALAGSSELGRVDHEDMDARVRDRHQHSAPWMCHKNNTGGHSSRFA